MCFFPRLNLTNKLALAAGIEKFECGHCPECLSKRARSWSLRAVYEARSRDQGCMITLTYDNYARDSHGHIVGELSPDRTLEVSKRDAQLFIKRLRKYVFDTTGRKIKYLLAAEYGSRTHRAHYHAIIFGYCFPDVFVYKRSRRNNLIYRSNTLTKLWGHGICTVDSISVNAATARYCTKYTAKNRSDETFMLFSHDVGIEELLKDFNGKSYFVEGVEHPIPRKIWNLVITKRYPNAEFDYRYINRYIVTKSIPRSAEVLNPFYEEGCYLRKSYRVFRDNNILYQGYKRYWRNKIAQREVFLPSAVDRIRALPDSKYQRFKIAALRCLEKRSRSIPFPVPGVSMTREYGRFLFDLRTPLGCLDPELSSIWRQNRDAAIAHLPATSCPIRANDTNLIDLLRFPLKNSLKSLDKGVQLCYDSFEREVFS